MIDIQPTAALSGLRAAREHPLTTTLSMGAAALALGHTDDVRDLQRQPDGLVTALGRLAAAVDPDDDRPIAVGDRAAYLNDPMAGVVLAAPAVDPDGVEHPEPVEIQWDDDEVEIAEVVDLQVIQRAGVAK